MPADSGYLFTFSLYDKILIFASIFLSVLFPVGLHYASPPACEARVIENGKVLRDLALDHTSAVPLALSQGGSIELETRDGKIRVVRCSCPNGMCVRTGWIQRTGQSIICAPNKVLVEVRGNTPSEYDAVTY